MSAAMTPVDPQIVARVRGDAIDVDAVLDAVTAAIASVPAAGGCGGWCSAAQRGYAARIDELDDLLRQCWDTLDAASAELWAQVADLDRLAATAGEIQVGVYRPSPSSTVSQA